MVSKESHLENSPVRLIAIVLLSLLPNLAYSAELAIYPSTLHLQGEKATHRLMVVLEEKGITLAELSGKAKYTSSAPMIVTVDESGFVQGLRDGEASITAEVDGRKVTRPVTVSKSNVPSHPSFMLDVQPILTKNGCNSGSCHGALAGKGGLKLSLRGYDPESDHFVLTRQAKGRRVDLGDASTSLLVTKPTGKVPHGGGRKLDEGSIEDETLRRWITQGAPGIATQEKQLTKLEVYPPLARLKPEDTLSLIVRAVYSDGSYEDVTRRVKFGSSEETVAKMDEGGKLTVMGHGAAAMTIWYSNMVSTMNVISPYPTPSDKLTKFTAKSDKETLPGIQHNYIDYHVNRRLEQMRLPVSPIATEAELVRRMYLDTCGTLPKPDEVAKFLADKAPDKLPKLIDSLLARKEFVDYWTYKWSDLFLVSTRRLPQSNVWAFWQSIRQAVAENRPWDSFARKMITATGSNLDQGEVNYFVLHRDISDLVETTSVTFMGTSITCARCHNHPLEKWTQDQYWAMANLFARTGQKNGDRGAEIILQPLPEGEVLHLRRGVPMEPAPLDGQALKLDAAKDRRAHFADWLTNKNNPFFAKSVINRIWKNYYGRGLIEAEDDVRQTNPPTNEELLAALEADFVQNGYDLKRLMKQILSSATYQRSSNPAEGNEADDRFYSHYLIRRLKAEVILDAYSDVTGVPTPFNQVDAGNTGAFSKTNDYPVGTRALELPDTKVVSRFMKAFGRPEREVPCACERETESSVTQALHLNNGQTLNEKLSDAKSIVSKWLSEKTSDEAAITELYQKAFGRTPAAGEMKKLKEMLTSEAKEDRKALLEDLCWAVLTGKEFLFNR